ncbi:MAG: hypothetical protein ACOCXP_03840 [Candidatus Dojkabacteria bacterium]
MSNFWHKPKDEHIVYEALSAIADGRIELLGDNKARCTSTSRGKFYEIEYDPETNAIMSNDNMAYYVDEVSYPMVAMLIKLGELEIGEDLLKYFEGIKWKDINQRNKNNYMKSVKEFLDGIDSNSKREEVQTECRRIYDEVCKMKLQKLGKKKLPPKAY